MANEPSLLDLRAAAERAVDQLAGLNANAALPGAKQLVEQLRNAQEYERMARVAEAIGRIDAKDAKIRRLYAQALIEQGKATAAIDMLLGIVPGPPYSL